MAYPSSRVSSGSCVRPKEGAARPVDLRVARQAVPTVLKRVLRVLGHALGWSCYKGGKMDVGGSSLVLEGSEAPVVGRAWWGRW